jgi:methionine biosynthesis protein MetW
VSAVDGVLVDLIPEGARVLDLGCGGGELLAALARAKKARGQGVDISADAVARCLEKGVSVLQGDVDEGLPGYPDAAFDDVVLKDSLQEVKAVARVLKEAVRVGKRVIVALPHIARWRDRLRFLLTGRVPSPGGVAWHAGPPRRLTGIDDLRALCRDLGIEVAEERFLSLRGAALRWLPSLRAATVVAVLSGARHG